MNRTAYTLLLVLLMASEWLCAQTNETEIRRKFTIANSMVQAGRYEQAAQFYSEIIKEAPEFRPAYSRYVGALMELKQYDTALEMAQKGLRGTLLDIPLAARLGELYLFKSDTAAAIRTWEGILAQNSSNLQAYRQVGEQYGNKRLFQKALAVYEKARAVFESPFLFLTEVAQVYMLAGNYKQAASEWIKLIVDDPNKAGLVQRRLYRLNDDQMYDAYIVALEQADDQYVRSPEITQALKSMLVWLYTERGFYRKALAQARLQESISQDGSYPMFSMGYRLQSVNQFEMADQAFSFYQENPAHPFYVRSFEERVFLHKRWGDFILSQPDRNMTAARHKYATAVELINTFREEFPNRFLSNERLATLEIELILEYLHHIEQAEMRLSILIGNKDQATWVPEWFFLKGRLSMMKDDVLQARLFLTRAYKKTKDNDLQIKARYYLGLNDFVNGEYEFAKLQLRSIEDNQSSDLSNDALRLRAWIITGINSDSTSTELDLFAQIIGQSDKGHFESARSSIDVFLDEHQEHALAPFALSQWAVWAWNLSAAQAHSYFENQLQNMSNFIQNEEILWHRASLAENALRHEETPSLSEANLSPRLSQVISYYEDIILSYPNGFYAELSRERIRELQKRHSS